jgi:hypothetical protein
LILNRLMLPESNTKTRRGDRDCCYRLKPSYLPQPGIAWLRMKVAAVSDDGVLSTPYDNNIREGESVCGGVKFRTGLLHLPWKPNYAMLNCIEE